jgi:predicted nucleotidyltransferase
MRCGGLRWSASGSVERSGLRHLRARGILNYAANQTMTEVSKIYRTYQQDVAHAVQILKQEGCSEIYLFGSGARGNVSNTSDIDLAVRGCPPERFFHVLGKLLMEVDRPVDLVDLDASSDFVQQLLKEKQLVRLD